MNRLNEINSFADELTAIRRDLHAHPELGFEEHRTSGIVAEFLEGLGLEVHRGVGKTGVVGVLRGARPGRVIGLRADMDALPIEERTNLAWASKNTGVMHACGHDAHTTMLLGAARHLAGLQDRTGDTVFIFQPAEEGLGGARAMIDDGLFERFPCDEIYGLHNEPNGNLGDVQVNSGVAYAGADFFDVAISGAGAHGAYPHEGADVLAAAAALIQGFNSIISRNVPASHQAVLSVTRMNSGNAYNVMPAEARLGGTMRFISDRTAELIRVRMDEMAAGIGSTYGVSISIDRDPVFSVLENDADCAEAIFEIAAQVEGLSQPRKTIQTDMGSEDFADMLKIVPGAYFTLGHGGTVPLHNPGFVLDDEMLPYGAVLYSELALQRGRAT